MLLNHIHKQRRKTQIEQYEEGPSNESFHAGSLVVEASDVITFPEVIGVAANQSAISSVMRARTLAIALFWSC